MIKLINDDILNANFSELPPINLVITSPPYNVGIEYDTHNDMLTYEQYLEWSKQWIKKMYDVMAEDGRICINVPISATPIHLYRKGSKDINYPIGADLIHICQSVGFKYYRTIIWQKMGGSKTCWGSWRSASAPFVLDPNECIIILYKGTWKRKNKGISTITAKEFMTYTKNLWPMQPDTKRNHPAAFPPELPRRCIRLFSYQSDIICDPFTGSGTCGEVAVQEGRSFVGVEMSQAYYEMANNKIEIAKLPPISDDSQNTN
jgi:site-specific DNA-methyltransferase (adenine-specific)